MQGSKGDADRESRLVDTVGEGEDGMNSESSTETHTSPYVSETASGNLLCDTGSPNQVLRGNPEGWEVGGRIKRAGMCVYLWLIHADVQQKAVQYCNYPPIKNKIKFKKPKYCILTYTVCGI